MNTFNNTTFIGDVIEKNGKTIKENNLTKKHNLKLDSLVSLIKYNDEEYFKYHDCVIQDGVTLYVSKLTRDCDGTPLYSLSTRKLNYLTEDQFKIMLCENGISEDVIKPYDINNHEKLFLNCLPEVGDLVEVVNKENQYYGMRFLLASKFNDSVILCSSLEDYFKSEKHLKIHYEMLENGLFHKESRNFQINKFFKMIYSSSIVGYNFNDTSYENFLISDIALVRKNNIDIDEYKKYHEFD